MLSVCLGIAFATLPNDLDRFVYPMAPARSGAKIEIDVSKFPEGKAWAEKAANEMRTWYPIVTAMLATENWNEPKVIRLVIEPKISAPAWASGNTITCNGEWITQRPNDFGMVIHELAHVVQSYPGSDKTPGWLVEGIADYIRWWRYEPDAPRPRLNKERSKYTDGYGTTAYFLSYVSQKYDRRLVPSLDKAMRQKEDPLPIFKQMTGKGIDDLWSEFLGTLP
jgi:hypothetical protein